jgi:hypothetical protein
MLPDTLYPDAVVGIAFSLYVRGASFAQVTDTMRMDVIRDASGSVYTAEDVQAMVRQYLATIHGT